MSLMLPRIIDSLRGQNDQVAVLADDEFKRQFAALANQAEIFDFGDLKEPESGAIELTEPEWFAWMSGLIPTPADPCWFEFRLPGCTIGILISGKAPDLRVAIAKDYGPGSGLKHRAFLWGIWVVRASPETVAAEGKREFLDLWGRAVDEGVVSAAVTHLLVAYLSLMLASATTEIERTQPDPKLNRALLKIGKTPLPEHRVVRIIPNAFRRANPNGGTHASPRLHWRRSHLRRFDHRTPGAKWLPNEPFKDGQQGCWVTLIPRMLVGRPENGIVTHEYRVDHSTP